MGSTIASFLFLWAIICQYSPYELRDIIEKLKLRLRDYFDPYVRISIHEFIGEYQTRSKAYDMVEAYLSSNTTKSAKRLKAEIGTKDSNLVLSLDDNEIVTDEFSGVTVRWALAKVMSPTRVGYSEQYKRIYELSFHKRYREIVSKKYMKHVVKEGAEIRLKNRQRRLYSNCAGSNWLGRWSYIVFEHPASFETMALESDKKREIVEDLLAFSRSKDFYTRTGKAWKRGYLLYGPPGTGKSTMVAAMANLLGYDVYDLELTAVKDNTELRRLLIETTSKSIIVIEDIDCSLDLTGQRKTEGEKSSREDDRDRSDKERKEPREEGFGSSNVTLSGLLNFIDGLWSACGSERLIVFTTNYVEKLDPALIRRGRMDKHIELSYCNFEGFKVLAKNYLNLGFHQMFDTIESLMRETKITPADVAENLMPKSPIDDPERCLLNLIQALEEAKQTTAKKKTDESTEPTEKQAIQPRDAKDIGKPE